MGEIIIPTSAQVKALGLGRELGQDLARPFNNELGDYTQRLGSQVGRAVYEVMAGRNHERVQAFKNKSIFRFMFEFYKVVDRWAWENNYAYEDIEFRPETGLDPHGYIQLKVMVRPGATFGRYQTHPPVAASNNGRPQNLNDIVANYPELAKLAVRNPVVTKRFLGCVNAVLHYARTRGIDVKDVYISKPLDGGQEYDVQFRVGRK